MAQEVGILEGSPVSAYNKASGSRNEKKADEDFEKGYTMTRSSSSNDEEKAKTLTLRWSFASGQNLKIWEEPYTEVTDDPEQWGRNLIKRFNLTLKPGERRRRFVQVVVTGEIAPPDHKWVKLTAMTQQRTTGRPFDVMECGRCGITGKRFGLSQSVKIDSKYRLAVFRRCDTATEHIRKP